MTKQHPPPMAWTVGSIVNLGNNKDIILPGKSDELIRLQMNNKRLREALAAMLEHACLTVSGPCKGEKCSNCKEAKKVLEETGEY